MIKFSLTLLSYMGVWKPRGWRGSKAYLYYIYQFFVLFSNLSTIISYILVIRFENIELNDLFDKVAIVLGMTNVRQKMGCLLLERRSIKHICDKLEKSPFKPRDQQEQAISRTFDGLVRAVFLAYVMTVIAFGMYLGSRFAFVSPPDTLPYNGWYPFNYSEPTRFWLTSAFQVWTINTANIVDLVLDLFLSALFCHMCGQIRILKHRFKNMLEELRKINKNYGEIDVETKERLMISEWVEYHIDLINMIKYINHVFSDIIFLQFTVSSIIMCALAVLMSHADTGAAVTFVGYFGYLITFNTQIFQQCYCAHTLTNESAEITTGIYNANWPSMSNSTRKSVMIIMHKCHKPIMITSSFFIVLSLESYTKIVKLTYTIFNVLA